MAENLSHLIKGIVLNNDQSPQSKLSNNQAASEDQILNGVKRKVEKGNPEALCGLCLGNGYYGVYCDNCDRESSDNF